MFKKKKLIKIKFKNIFMCIYKIIFLLNIFVEKHINLRKTCCI